LREAPTRPPMREAGSGRRRGPQAVRRTRSAAERDQANGHDPIAASRDALNGVSGLSLARSKGVSAEIVVLDYPTGGRSPKARPVNSVAEMKARQAAKMREIREALIAEGFLSLDEQSAVLGLPRSSTWTIVKGNHKSSGLSADVIKRILSAPRLQPRVRKKILEYIEEKCAGRYGGSKDRLDKFVERVRHHSSG